MEALDDEREALITELEDFAVVNKREGRTLTAGLMFRAAEMLTRKNPEHEIAEWVSTLEALLAEVYTILKPLVVEQSHGTSSPLLKAFGLLDQQDYIRRSSVEGEVR